MMHWESISFVTYYHGRRLQWQIDQNSVKVKISAGPEIKLEIKGKLFEVQEGENEVLRE